MFQENVSMVMKVRMELSLVLLSLKHDLTYHLFFFFLTEQIRLKNIRNVYGRCMWYRLRLLNPQPNIIPTVK